MTHTADDILGVRPARPYLRAANSGTATRRGVTVLVPTHRERGGRRQRSIRACLESVAMAGTRELPLAAMVVADGLSDDDVGVLRATLRAAGLAGTVVRSRPAGGAALARNAGLTALAALAADSPLRSRHLLFLDDDSALAPDALPRLVAALEARPRAIAVCSRIVSVEDVAEWRGAAGRAPGGPAEPLPGALRGGRYDLLSAVSHSSLVAGRVVGLLVRQDPLLDWIRDGGRLFFEGTPCGSAEDLLAMASLSRLGELWRLPAAEVADEVRRSPGETRRQQMAWGYDHAWLARALAEAGLLDPGVHALVPDSESGWKQVCVTRPGVFGCLVHPPELLLAADVLRALALSAPGARMFGVRAAAIERGTRQMTRVVRRWRRALPRATCVPRPDLPARDGRHWDALREGLDSLLGRVAGNVLGSSDNGADGSGMPRFFVYGARQSSLHSAHPGEQIRDARESALVT